MLELELNVSESCLNPFEVREVLQVLALYFIDYFKVSIPLKSGRCCKNRNCDEWNCNTGLNPFEVREVLQVSIMSVKPFVISLNPFEVREVLQVLEVLCF